MDTATAPAPRTGAAPASFSSWNETACSAKARKAAAARNASGRRRFVDPATCDRDYSAAEWEFMQAMHEYKLRNGRPFPTWSEVLDVLQDLGYGKAAG